MSQLEEFLELQERVSQLESALKKKNSDISEKDEKILTLSEKINQLTNDSVKASSDSRHYRSMMSSLDTEKKNLERERDRLLKEIDTLNSQSKQFANMVETTNQTLQAKEEMLLSKEKQLQSKDLLIVEKDEKIEDFRRKFDVMSVATEKYQAEKFSFMEQVSNEKLELVEKLGKNERILEEKDRKINELRKKARDAQDGLLGASFEMEKVREEASKVSLELQETNQENDQIKEENEQLTLMINKSPEQAQAFELLRKLNDESSKPGMIKKYKEKIASLELKLRELEKNGGRGASKGQMGISDDLFERETGTYQSVSTLITHFKFNMNNVNRTIRLILPDLSFVDKYDLTETLFALPNIVLKNLACNVDPSRDSEILDELKSRNFKVTDYKDTKLFALAVDNAIAAVAVFEESTEAVTGLFSSNSELVKFLSQAVMTPFIKGTKLN
ncbi:MAG: hypothetical protein E4G98_04300 [Promethearchaeota archaeon]|nr:MAG: hypothetical protein E4G98_04300 [Candidatus Lokiarchaeota archaeon]